MPRYADPSVGILPHTVMDYALEDSRAPVYGRSNFGDIRELILEENAKRPVWYFPETSYFIAMDIDVPLFLTDYLLARSRDMDDLEDHGIRGQIDFTTGHELGYWLMDWTVALLANRENRGHPLIALELLKENIPAWRRIVDFQHEYIQRAGLLGILSSSTLLDEIPFVGHSVHERVLISDLRFDRKELNREIEILEAAEAAIPSVEEVRNRELKAYLEITFLRIRHALHLRRALTHPADTDARDREIRIASGIRSQALALISEEVRVDQRYPEAAIFSEQENPTSYGFGYGWTAATLRYWEREEKMIEGDDYSPFFMNIYDPCRILF